MKQTKKVLLRPDVHINKLDLNDGDDIFGHSAGEDENPEVLNSYFVELPKFRNFYNLKVSLSIASARKGMGKSALLSRLKYVLDKKVEQKKIDAIVLKVTGNDLIGLEDVYGKDHIYLENFWKRAICKRINLEIGNNISIALTPNEISMVEASELEGAKSKNLVGFLISRFKLKLKFLPVEIKEREGVPENWEARLHQYQEKHEKSDIWLLVDDIDAKYINSEEHRTIISSFFSAIRSLAVEMNNLYIRTTVRTDVWTNLVHVEDLDKCSDYIFEIEWSREKLKQMLVKRIQSYIRRKYSDSVQAKYDAEEDSDKLLQLVFMKTIPWGKRKNGEVRYLGPHYPITELANHRPRWMGQLCKKAAKKTYKSGQPKIGSQGIRDSMRDFGKDRLNDLLKEHGYQFGDLDTLVNSFREGARYYNFSALIKCINGNYISYRGDSNIPDVDSYAYKSPEQLGEFLFKIGFIDAKGGIRGGYFRYQDDPSLFTAPANKQDKVIWSIHPIYREFLGIK